MVWLLYLGLMLSNVDDNCVIRDGDMQKPACKNLTPVKFLVKLNFYIYYK